MAKIEEILKEWDEDCIIDDNHISNESVKVPQLHSKYVRYLINTKLKLTKYENDFNILKKTKFRYYRGELSREELVSNNWDQWQGTKPMKNEMDQFLEGDSDLNILKTRIEYLNTAIYLLESILKQISARDWQLKNMLEHKKFLAGN